MFRHVEKPLAHRDILFPTSVPDLGIHHHILRVGINNGINVHKTSCHDKKVATAVKKFPQNFKLINSLGFAV